MEREREREREMIKKYAALCYVPTICSTGLGLVRRTLVVNIRDAEKFLALGKRKYRKIS